MEIVAVTQKRFSFNCELNVAYIDFEKAFDSISRKLLWPILVKNCVTGKLYCFIRSIHKTDKELGVALISLTVSTVREV